MIDIVHVQIVDFPALGEESEDVVIHINTR